MTIPAIKVVAAVIANGQTKTGEVLLHGYRLGAIILGTMTGATITLEASNVPGGTFVAVVDSAGAAFSITASDDKCVVLPASGALDVGRLPVIKLVSASAEAAERTIYLVLERA